MKIHGSFSVGNKHYKAGDEVPWKHVYPFFLIHMLAFGASGFAMAYGSKTPDISFLYMHGGIAIAVYLFFYFAIFGVDEFKWMFLNALFGLLGIYAQVGWLLSLFGKQISGYPLHVHLIPFLYFVLYSFLMRRAILDFTRSNDNAVRQKKVENRYIIFTLGINMACVGLQQL